MLGSGCLLAFVLILATADVEPVQAGPGEMLCINPKFGDPTQGSTIACYTDDGCKFATSLGGELIRDFDPASAPFALARGKIGAIVTSSTDLIDKTKNVGGTCRATTN